MDFIEGGIYRPIRVMFDTPIYERALQTCWHMGSYKCQIALMSELLRLQQKDQLPSAVTAEDITEFLMEESKCTLRVQLWEFELEDYDADVRPLLRLAWEVNTSMKMRDIEFEAARLLSSPEAAPPQFKHPKIISEAQMYARRLTEQQQEARGPKQLSPREVVMEVVPKVLQGFWLPPPNTFLNMPSQQLCTMAVGVTQAVEDRVFTALSSINCQVPFSCFVRDNMVLSIQEKVRQDHPQEILLINLNCFATEVLNTIADVAAKEICVLFQPQTNASIQSAVSESEQQTESSPSKSAVAPAPLSPISPPTEVILPVLEPDHRMEEFTKEPDSAAVQAPTPPATSPAEEPSSVVDPEKKNKEPTKEPDSAVHPAPLFPMTPPVEVTPPVLDHERRMEEHTRDPDSAIVPVTPPPVNSADEPPVTADTQEDMKFSQDKPRQQPTSSPEPSPVIRPAEAMHSVPEHEGKNEEPTRESNSAILSAPQACVTPPNGVPVITAVQDELVIMELPISVDESFCTTPEKEMGGFSFGFGFCMWLKRKICRCFLTENNIKMG